MDPSRRRPHPTCARPAPRRLAALLKRWSLRALGLTAAVAAVGACVWVPPEPGSVPRHARLAAFPSEDLPLRAPAVVRWNEQMVPFIVAEDELDVPFLIGVVHGHLRRTQIELLRRVARGELSQMGGPFARPVDELLRTLDLDRAVPEIVAALPDESRAWLERYVEGLNLQAERTTRRPYDARLLGIERGQHWSVEDVIACARVASVDISLGRTIGLLALREEPRFGELLSRLKALDAAGSASFGPEAPTPLSGLASLSKSGSNSFVVAGSGTASGAPLIANDPHLGFFVPNFWCLIGYRTPEHTVVGLTLPGVPAVVLGRNERIAFGGTNMLSYSSALYDVSQLDASEIVRREEVLPTRLWCDAKIEIAETPFGPILSDLALFERLDLPPLALRWRGHEPSDEFSAFLRASHARDWSEFRAAFADYAVAGQNLLFASADGHIGQLMALEQIPAAAHAGAALIADPADPRCDWPQGLRATPSTGLPAELDPETGFLVSANNTPIRTTPPLVAGGNSNDRVDRIAGLIEEKSPVNVQDAVAIQRDVYLTSGHSAARALVAALGETSSEEVERFAALLRDWDGHFRRESRAALAYQRLVDVLLATHYREAWGERIERYLRGATCVHAFLAQDLASGELPRAAVASAFAEAAAAHDETQVWGDVHRLYVQHPLGGLPYLGWAWRFDQLPADGTNGTIQKTAGPLTTERHRAYFGAQARHVSDLSDPDANHFVLFGGQDGWIGSENFIDQVELWERGEFVQLPLRPESIERLFPEAMQLRPGGSRD